MHVFNIAQIRFYICGSKYETCQYKITINKIHNTVQNTRTRGNIILNYKDTHF